MNIIIYTKNVDVPAAFKKQLEQKFNKLVRLVKQVISFRVDLSHDTHHRKGPVYRVEVNLTIPEKMFRVVEQDFDLLTGVNRAKEILTRQLIDYKERLISQKRKLRI